MKEKKIKEALSNKTQPGQSRNPAQRSIVLCFRNSKSSLSRLCPVLPASSRKLDSGSQITR